MRAEYHHEHAHGHHRHEHEHRGHCEECERERCVCCARHEHHCHEYPCHHHRDDCCRECGGDGGKKPGRPSRQPGTSTGELNGGPITPGQITGKNPPTVWPGPRPQMWLPYLFMRANPGDTGARPVVGPFWESPDVYILAGIAPSAAPDLPPQLGQTALAGQANTVYAHVWNLGRAAAREVAVEFYWCNPALGFNPVGATLIGTTFTTLGSRDSGASHRVVKCPEAWTPTFVNGGHECLLVRAWDVAADPLTTPEWDASINRHLGQRNIHVVPPGQTFDQQIKLTVGPLFGQPAQIAVARAVPTAMPWLQLHTGVRGGFPEQAMPTGLVGLGNPGGLLDQGTLTVTDEGQPVAVGSSDAPPAPGAAHVYRVTASQNGQIFGGYSVVVLG